jgi:hypothetical protein
MSDARSPTTVLAGIAVIALGAWWAGSAWWAVSSLADAARRHDNAALMRWVDQDAVARGLAEDYRTDQNGALDDAAAVIGTLTQGGTLSGSDIRNAPQRFARAWQNATTSEQMNRIRGVEEDLRVGFRVIVTSATVLFCALEPACARDVGRAVDALAGVREVTAANWSLSGPLSLAIEADVRTAVAVRPARWRAELGFGLAGWRIVRIAPDRAYVREAAAVSMRDGATTLRDRLQRPPSR